MQYTELWRLFPLDTRYEVSTLGRVRRLDTQKIRKCPIKQSGYRGLVFSYGNGKQKGYDLHFIIAITWLGPRPFKLDISHLDGDKLNNRVSNLAYESRKENANKSFNSFNKFGARRKLSPELVYKIRKSKKTNNWWAMKLSVTRKTIWKVRKRITWKHLP